ncbi:MAG: acetoacetate decarboxylase family protein [Gammaproteobacteria bacterium]|nr:acetoacetate decarboxylase family protein [Gammaproteobacteria bacterium]
MRSLRVRYETDPEIHAALLPRPLQPSARPEIFIQHANVSMHVRPGQDVDIGAATVGVKCSFEGTEGYYVLAMPMQGEFVVIGGRERFGEPKKIAEVASMEIDGNRVTTVIARHGIAFLEMRGEIGESLAVPAPFMEYFFCHKGAAAHRRRRRLRRTGASHPAQLAAQLQRRQAHPQPAGDPARKRVRPAHRRAGAAHRRDAARRGRHADQRTDPRRDTRRIPGEPHPPALRRRHRHRHGPGPCLGAESRQCVTTPARPQWSRAAPLAWGAACANCSPARACTW